MASPAKKRKVEDQYEEEAGKVLGSQEGQLTESEVVQYDRQIRLWGVEVQRRLRGARVLVVGANGLAAEVCKNIVLAGIHSMTIMDHNEASWRDMASQFFIPQTDIGKNRAQASVERLRSLNPQVMVSAIVDDVMKQPDQFFGNYDLVCLMGGSFHDATVINTTCRKLGIKYFFGDVMGMHGFYFADLLSHTYIDERKEMPRVPKGTDKNLVEPVTILENKMEEFVPLDKVLAFSYQGFSPKRLPPRMFFALQVLEKIRSSNLDMADAGKISSLLSSFLLEQGLPSSLLHQDYICELLHTKDYALSPVCAVVGGVLANEIIKAISLKHKPLNNFFFYDGNESTGLVERLGPVPHSQGPAQQGGHVSVSAGPDASSSEIIEL